MKYVVFELLSGSLVQASISQATDAEEALALHRPSEGFAPFQPIRHLRVAELPPSLDAQVIGCSCFLDENEAVILRQIVSEQDLQGWSPNAIVWLRDPSPELRDRAAQALAPRKGAELRASRS